MRIEPGAGELAVTLFFDSKHTFKQGELLLLQIRDPETEEQFPPGGITLRKHREDRILAAANREAKNENGEMSRTDEQPDAGNGELPADSKTTEPTA